MAGLILGQSVADMADEMDVTPQALRQVAKGQLRSVRVSPLINKKIQQADLRFKGFDQPKDENERWLATMSKKELLEAYDRVTKNGE